MSVCRHWHAIMTDTHAKSVWQALCIDDVSFNVDLGRCHDSWIAWCRAYGCHVRDLQVSLARRYLHVRIQLTTHACHQQSCNNDCKVHLSLLQPALN